MRKNSLSINHFKDADKLMQWCAKNKDAMAEIMLILTEGETSKFDAALMLKGLTAENLQYAVLNNKLKLAELCLIAGVSPNGLPDKNILAETKNIYLLRVENFGKDNLLNIAIRAGFHEMRKLLLQYGADPNGAVNLGHLGCPLYAAIEMEDVEAVKDLLSYGSKQNIVRVPSANDAVTVSPLYRALEIYYEKKLHKTDKFKNFIKNIESLRVQNQAENNMLLSLGGVETIPQHKLPHNIHLLQYWNLY